MIKPNGRIQTRYLGEILRGHIAGSHSRRGAYIGAAPIKRRPPLHILRATGAIASVAISCGELRVASSYSGLCLFGNYGYAQMQHEQVESAFQFAQATGPHARRDHSVRVARGGVRSAADGSTLWVSSVESVIFSRKFRPFLFLNRG
jgi:hypothetical protein